MGHRLKDALDVSLQYNDNSANPFSDGNWLAVVIEAVGAAKYSPQVRHQHAPMVISGSQSHLNVDTLFSQLLDSSSETRPSFWWFFAGLHARVSQTFEDE